MTSHIFVALGMWDEVVAANEAAVQVVNGGRAAHGHEPSACGHYNFWLEYGYLQQGRFGEAIRVLSGCYAAARRSAAAVPSGPGRQLLDPDNSLVGSFAAMRTRYLIDTEDWTSEVVGWTIPTGGQWRSQLAFEFGTGYAAARSGRRADAVSALERLSRARQDLVAALPKNSAERAETLAREWARILEVQLTAVIEAAEPATAAGVAEKLHEVSSAEERMPYEFGPPAVDKPSYELLGEVLLAMRQPVDARAAFEKALARTPERTASLRGLMLAADSSGDARKATDMRARLRAIWHHADRLPADIR
jgi:hypothetical protein